VVVIAAPIMIQTNSFHFEEMVLTQEGWRTLSGSNKELNS